LNRDILGDYKNNLLFTIILYYKRLERFEEIILTKKNCCPVVAVVCAILILLFLFSPNISKDYYGDYNHNKGHINPEYRGRRDKFKV